MSARGSAVPSGPPIHEPDRVCARVRCWNCKLVQVIDPDHVPAASAPRCAACGGRVDLYTAEEERCDVARAAKLGLIAMRTALESYRTIGMLDGGENTHARIAASKALLNARGEATERAFELLKAVLAHPSTLPDAPRHAAWAVAIAHGGGSPQEIGEAALAVGRVEGWYQREREEAGR